MSFSFNARAILLFDFLAAFLELAGVLSKVLVAFSSICSNLSCTTVAEDVAADFRVTLRSVALAAGVLNKIWIDSPSAFSISSSIVVGAVLQVDILVTFLSVAGVLNKVWIDSPSVFSMPFSIIVGSVLLIDFLVTFLSVVGVLNKFCIDTPTSFSVWPSTVTI